MFRLDIWSCNKKPLILSQIMRHYLGREKVHYIAPLPERMEGEMAMFLDWFNRDENVSSVIRSAIAHLWFVSILSAQS